MLKNPQQKRHFMEKSEYVHLLATSPWKEMQNHFDSIPTVDMSVSRQLDINTAEWVRFSIDNFDLATQKWEEPKSHYTDESNKWATVNNSLGRNKHNSFELNYGMLGDGNDKLKTILGRDNIKLLGIDWDTVLVRLIVKFPGHGMAWHCDSLDSYVLKFSVDDPSKVRRYWFSIDDWYDGHVFQVSKTVLNNWTKGAAYNIPFGIGHASSNFGYRPMYSVSFTGVLDS